MQEVIKLKDGIYAKKHDFACVIGIDEKGNPAVLCSPFIDSNMAKKSHGNIDKLKNMLEDVGYVGIYPHNGWIEADIGPIYGSRDVIDSYKCYEKGNILHVVVGWD